VGLAVLAALTFAAAGEAAAAVPVIIDTDFAASAPSDDALAVLLALRSPELDVLGITTVAGNDSLERATSDVLRVLEIAGRAAVPVHAGADMPLVHAAGAWERAHHGRWWSDDPPSPPPGGFAARKAEPSSAAEFLVRSVRQRPRELTIIAIGPLTNLAIALRSDPAFAGNVKRLVIMGGAIAALPDGTGNMTPNAEFNFWVDPEAAHVVLRSGIPIQLSPLNVSRKTNLTRAWYERMVAVETPLTGLLRFILGSVFDNQPERRVSMFDEVAVAAVIDPTLVKTREMYVDVDIHPGINYGVSVGGDELWPGAEGARRMSVQYDLDWERFAKLLVARLTARD
jgi:inosine-uridine nucleoside N-ribohydrolase